MTAVVQLEVRHLTAGYRGRPVIGNLSLPVIEGGRLVALVGPNAAGKSTLLRALAGLAAATGQVMLNGVDLLHMSRAQRAEYVAFMPQTLPVRTGLSVIESLVSLLRLSGNSEGASLQQSLAMLDQLAIADLAMASFDHLSGGQRQLVSLAQTLVRQPRLLLLDEPTSALDLRHQVEVMKIVRAHAAAGAIVLAVLHDLALAARWADAVAVFNHGKLHCAGPPGETVNEAMLAEVYGVASRVDKSGSALRISILDSCAIRSTGQG